MQKLLYAFAIVLLAACSSSGPAAVHSPSPVTGGLTQGLIAYAADQGIGVMDPATGKGTIVAPLQPGTFRVAGPVWGPTPEASYPVLYFTVHDDRSAEGRTTAGVVPYDWIFRVDPFTGVIEPVAANQDSQSEGPIGLVANGHYLALTVGCCASYEVDALDLTQAAAPLKALAKPPTQPPFFTEGAAPGGSGLIAVREFGNGGWYWLNADAGVLNPFPLNLGMDDGPIAITSDGTMAAVALPDHGAVIEPINTALPLETPSSSATAGAQATPSPRATPSVVAGPKRVNSKLPHPDGLAWSPDAKQLALAVNGGIEIYAASAADGTAPTARDQPGANVIGVAWSGPIPSQTFASVKPSLGPQAMADALLKSTALPAQADTPANRPLTKVYVWQFDSTKSSPIESIADATPAVLAQYPPMSAAVVFHHWAASDTWALLGGCYRYRVVITGSVAPFASTFGLTSNTLCSAKPTPTPKTSPTAKVTPTPSHS
jgi:hypothetical protein